MAVNSESGASAESAQNTSSAQKDLERASGSTGFALLAQAHTLERQLGLKESNLPFTAKDIGEGPEQTIRSDMASVAALITASAYGANMAFAVGAIVKFKAHKDNPTQIPIGTPIALLFVAAALLFIPTILDVPGQTMFGAEGTHGEVFGLLDFGVPKAVEAEKSAGATQKTARGPLLGERAKADIKNGLEAHGITGRVLGTYTQLGVIAAEAIVAGARA